MGGVSNSNHINVRKTHCPQGHEYSVENTAYVRNNRNGSIGRKCKACESARAKAYYIKTRRAALGHSEREN